MYQIRTDISSEEGIISKSFTISNLVHSCYRFSFTLLPALYFREGAKAASISYILLIVIYPYPD